jgi:hypothetical protein
MWKIAASVGAISLMLCATTESVLAKPAANGGHPAGGGHHGGGGHFSNARVAVPHSHVAGTRITHFVVPHAVHLARPAHLARPSLSTPGGRASRFTRVTPSLVKPMAAGSRTFTAAGQVTPLARSAAFRADPRAFAAHRHFAGDPEFRPFLDHGWHPYHHLGWVGPVFWPYAYGDFFYYALWPNDYGYVDPLWAYGYGDIYEGIFSPYLYDEYVQGPGAPAQMAKLTQGMAQSCADEAAEVTGWPVSQIQDAVQPSQPQSALLDDLGNAIVKASDEIRTHCPTTVSFTPTDRLAEMRQRLQTLVDAVNIVSPPLAKFYDALNDEQKARFNDMEPTSPKSGQTSNAPSPQAQCGANVMAWPTDQIDRAVQPDDAQRAKLEALQSAATQAADTIKAACPSEMPATPPSRLAAVGNRLQAMLQAVETVQPALTDFYGALNDDQKARFNAMGKQIFAANKE